MPAAKPPSSANSKRDSSQAPRRREALRAASTQSALGLRVAAWALVLLTVAAFGRICLNEFTLLDDDVNISHNPGLNPPGVSSLKEFWRQPYEQMYVPVVYTVWSAVATVDWRDQPDPFDNHVNPRLYHLTSLIVHMGTALLALAILRRLSGRTWAAFAGAALFALHPVQVETVAWATALKEGLSGFFGLLSLWFYLVGATTSSPDPPERSTAAPLAQIDPAAARPLRSVLLTIAAAVSLALALLSNPLAVVIPAMAAAIDWFILRRPIRKIALGLAPLIAVAAGGVVVARLAQPGYSAPALPFWTRPLVVGDTLAFYLYKLILPVNLAVDYGRRPELALARHWLYWTWIVPAALVVAIVLWGRRRRWLLAGAALFVLGVAPVLGLVSFDYQRFSTPADRYLYFAMLGPALIVTGWFSIQRDAWQRAAWGMALALLAGASAVQSGVWKDEPTLWWHNVYAAPDSYFAHTHLGAFYERLNLATVPEAIDQYQQAVRIYPDYFEGHNHLAMALSSIGLVDEAIPEMKTTLRIEQTMKHFGQTTAMAEPRYELGMILLKRGRPAEALEFFEQARQYNPYYPGLGAAMEKARAIVAAPAHNPAKARP